MCASGDIGGDELLYRKIPVSQGWYDRQTRYVSPYSFNPRPDDIDGISLERSRSETHPEFRTAEQAAVGNSKRGYFIAVLKVSDILAAGMSVVAKPIEGVLGHVQIPELTHENRKSVASEEFKVTLAHKLVTEVLGPLVP